MTKQIYLQPVKHEGKYVLTDKVDYYKLPQEDADTYIKAAIRHENSICLKFADDKWTARRSKKEMADRPQRKFDELKTILLPKTEKKMSEGQKEVASFMHDAIDKKPQRLKIADLKWKYLIRSAYKGKNIMMTGPSGTGKTFAVQSLSKAFPEHKFAYFNLGSTQDPRSTLIGNTHFSTEKGTYFAESTFVKAIQTPNTIILLDELSRAHPEAMNILMTVLDYSQRYLRLDESDGSPVINVAKGVSFIATANIGNEYTATRVLDRALLDRFTIIEMDMLTKDQEVELLTEMFPDVDGKDVNAIAEIADITRKTIMGEDSKISTIVSTRVTCEIAELIHDGFTLGEAAEVAIYPFYPEDGGADSERTFIKQAVQKFLVPEEDAVEETIDEEDTDWLSDEPPF